MCVKILFRNQMHCPIVVCDVCGDMIANVNEGAVVFPCSAPENSKLSCLHVHKGDCHDKAEENQQNAGWEELGAHMAFVMSNLGIDLERFRELQASLAMRRECGL
jgi:hypothetical protein